MILKPFSVENAGKTYTFVDRLAIDSEPVKQQVTDITATVLDYSQFEATCEQLGQNAEGSIPSMKLGVFESGSLVGIWMLGCIQYVSGPWVDTIDWVKTSEDPALFTARVMPGFIGLGGRVEDAISITAAAYLLGRNAPHRTTEDLALGFDSLHWAIFKDLTDPISVRALRQHNAAAADPRLVVTEEIDRTAADRTLVKLELA